MSTPIQNNSEGLQRILQAVNSLPEAGGGIQLPALDDAVEGAADDLVVGKKLYNDQGSVVEGSNPYKKAETDAEVTSQGTLLDQALAAIQNKAAGGNSGDLGDVTVVGSTDVGDVPFYLTSNVGDYYFVYGEFSKDTLFQAGSRVMIRAPKSWFSE